ncbi:TetR family transcriptional regulator [Nocardioides psychrotolerans]|uniref:Transcriptional regulator, TetR family n=1 Tax=Nocardioides psychrotolerans TaxID=1005945 RepID=A0A1I3E3X3_9ACTN|nr:TetR family transcriptional regulator [Nocardioides psychrotolerans]GEP37525.1 TetR family transcriptional regulator [Nocardioides psychrotolerans]SFH93548.1 transcriptional regulator, TetR family [Nocardioides psychrotolerans]
MSARAEPSSEPTPEPRLGLRERRRNTTRRSLEDAALRLFARDGFDATTVEAIAAEADVSPRTFFRYFAAKDEVLNPDRRARQALLREAVAAAPAGLDDLATAFVALAAVADDLAADREMLLLQRQAVVTSALLRGRTYDVLLSWQHTLTAALADRRGVPHDDLAALSVAAAATGVWQAAIGRWLDAEDTDLGDLLTKACSSLGGRPDGT